MSESKSRRNVPYHDQVRVRETKREIDEEKREKKRERDESK